MKWYSMDEYIPPQEVLCLVFTKLNYLFTATWMPNVTDELKIDGFEWINEVECSECVNGHHPIREVVTHFALIPPVKKGSQA